MFMTCRSGLQNNSTDEKGPRNAFDSWLKCAISEWNQNFKAMSFRLFADPLLAFFRSIFFSWVVFPATVFPFVSYCWSST